MLPLVVGVAKIDKRYERQTIRRCLHPIRRYFRA